MPSQNYRVFISYSRQDEAQKRRLLIHLSSLKHDQTISIWHDRCIDAGALWRKELDEAMSEAEIALFLVSADFLASEFCQKARRRRPRKVGLRPKR